MVELVGAYSQIDVCYFMEVFSYSGSQVKRILVIFLKREKLHFLLSAEHDLVIHGKNIFLISVTGISEFSNAQRIVLLHFKILSEASFIFEREVDIIAEAV